MSKLYNMYIKLKAEDSNTIYLFKSGIFLIGLDKDAYTLSNIFNFKLGNLNNDIVKCGFPINSLDKYLNLFSSYNLTVKIIDPNSNSLLEPKNYYQNKDIKKLIELINSVEINNLSVSEAYNFIESLQNISKNIDL